jgi:hypothetical protein
MDPSALLVSFALAAVAYCKIRTRPMRGGSDGRDWAEAMDAIATKIEDACGQSVVFTDSVNDTACCVCDSSLSRYENTIRSFDAAYLTYYIPAPEARAARSIVVCEYDEEDEEVVVHLVCANPEVPRIAGITFHLLMYALCDVKSKYADFPVKLNLSDDDRARKLYVSLGFGCPGRKCDLNDEAFSVIVDKIIAREHVEAANSAPVP